jgi:hypothetical protein
MPTLGRPSEHVGNLAVKLPDAGEIALFGVPGVEGQAVLDDNTGGLDAEIGVVGRDDSEPLSIWLPREGGDEVFELNDFDGDVGFAQPVDFEIARGGLLGLGLPRVTVDLDTEVVTLVLVVEFALIVSVGPFNETCDSRR